LTKDHDYIWCTSREKQIPLYQAIGFELMSDESGEPIAIEYKLRGKWYTMVASWTKVLEEPGRIPNFAPDFFAQIIKQIERVDPEEWIQFSKRFNDLADKTNYYTAFFVADGK
jgi:hypothetical protein